MSSLLDRPIVVICGVTGQQGGSVARYLHATGKYRLRGVTRDPLSDKSKAIQKECPGLELFKADMLDQGALQLAMNGAQTVFCVTDFYTPRNLEKAKKGEMGELDEGSTVARAAKECGVQYFIMSSLCNAERESKSRWKVMHFTGKHKVSEFARSLGLKVLDIMPGVFMQNFTTGLFPTIETHANGSIEWRLPVRHDVGLPFIDIDQYGSWVARALEDPAKWTDKVVIASQEYLTLDQAAAIYSQVSGTPTYYKRQTMEEYKKENAKLPFVDEYVEQFSWFNEFGYYNGVSLGPTLKDFPATRTFREWLLKSGWRTKPSVTSQVLSAVGLGGSKGEVKGEQVAVSSNLGVKDATGIIAASGDKEAFDFERAGKAGAVNV